MVRIPSFQCHGQCSGPGQGTETPQAMQCDQVCVCVGFPGSSAGKGSTCNAGDPGSISGSGRSLGEEICSPLQYSWPSLVAQMIKNLPAMWEAWVQSLGWEDPLEDGMATHDNILACGILMDRGAWWATVRGIKNSWR